MKNCSRLNILLITLIFLLPSKELLPQTEQLDTTFGQGGVIETALNFSGINTLNSTAIQSDGKIVAVGTTYNIGNPKRYFALVRYNTNGTLDNTFGTNGFVITSIGTSLNNQGNSVIIQDDGKIVAAGFSSNGKDDDFVLIRYNQNGALDNTFGTKGIVMTPVGTSFDEAQSVAIQSDGKIIAGGYAVNGSYYDFALVRYNANGGLDNTFGTNGIVATPIDSLHDNILRSIAIQTDGKIVAAGYIMNGKDDFALVRYNQNGALDNTFGTKGIVVTHVGTFINEAQSVVIQSDGKIIAAGYAVTGGSYNFCLIRYNVNGDLDNTFGKNGVVTNPVSSSDDFAQSVVLQSDGKIVVGGNSRINFKDDFSLARYNLNGDFDSTFGTNGVVITQGGTTNNFVNSVKIQTDGKIVAAGKSTANFALTRYNINGDLDNAFGTYGIVTTSAGKTNDEANSLTIQSDKKILAAGFSFNGTDNDFALVRYNSAGVLDNAFGSNGVLTMPIGVGDDKAYSNLGTK